MNNEEIKIINKIFDTQTIRTVWDKKKEKYYISIVDIVEVVTASKDGRKYWNKLKQRLKLEGDELVTKCHQLKLKAQDGKYRMTDVCDIEEMFRIIESIPSKNAEPIKRWLANLGKERINETFDPSITLQRAIDLYRKKLTDLWKENGVKDNIEYAILTNEIYKAWSGMSAKEYKQYKGLRKENLRDNMDNIELILTDLSEEATKRITEKKKPQGLRENIKVAKKGGKIAKIARDELEGELGESVISQSNKISYKYIESEKENN